MMFLDILLAHLVVYFVHFIAEGINFKVLAAFFITFGFHCPIILAAVHVVNFILMQENFLKMHIKH